MRRFLFILFSLLLTVGSLAATFPIFIFNVPSSSGGVSVASLLPDNGGSGGGTAITITGAGFTGVTAVHVGGTSATYSFVDDNHITVASMPAKNLGNYYVTVTTPGGTSPTVPKSQFTYADLVQVFTSCTSNAGGQTWPNSGCTPTTPNPTGGTETRFLQTHDIPAGDALQDGTTCTSNSREYKASDNACAVMWLGNGWWNDTACLGTPQPRGPYIYAMTDPHTTTWYKDTELDVGYNCAGTTFDTVNSLYDMLFSYDTTGAPITPTKILMAAGIAPDINARNDADSTWHSSIPTVTTVATNAISAAGSTTLTFASTTGITAGLGVFDITTPTALPVSAAALVSSVAGATHTVTISTPIVGPGVGSGDVIGFGASDYPRSMDEFVDDTGSPVQDYVFAPNNDEGMFYGTFSGWPTGFVWSSGVEFYSSDGVTSCTTAGGFSRPEYCTNLLSDYPPGTQGNHCTGAKPDRVMSCLSPFRIMGMTKCPVTSGGNNEGYAEFQIVGDAFYRRTMNGSAHPHLWQLWALVPAAVASNASDTSNGLRALACVPWAPYAAGYALLAGVVQTTGNSEVFRVDPSTQGVIENDTAQYANGLDDVLAAGWPHGAGGPHSSIVGYNGNQMASLGHALIFGDGDNTGTPNTKLPAWSGGAGAGTLGAVSGLFIRTVSGTTVNYTVWPPASSGYAGSLLQTVYNSIAPRNATPPIGTAETTFCTAVNNLCPVMGATRTQIASPFPTDANASGVSQKLCFGGFDNWPKGSAAHDTAWAVCAPASLFGNAINP